MTDILEQYCPKIIQDINVGYICNFKLPVSTIKKVQRNS